MKKSFLILLFPLLLVGCNGANPDQHECIDNDNNHYCDVCDKKISSCIDNDKDGYCDICENEFVPDVIGITIKKQPAKVKYYVGEVFDPKGMVVNANFSDGTYAPIENYTYSTQPLKLTDTVVTITFQDFSKNISITVIEKQAVDDEYTATIDFHSTDFASRFPEGTNFDNDAKFQALLEYIDDQLDYYDLINTLTLVKGTSRKVNSSTYLQIGTGSGEGSLSWSCKEKIYSIEVKAMAYSKYDSYHGVWNVDRNAHINVAGTDFSLEVPSGEPEIIPLEPVVFDDGVTNFKISSSGGRVLISEMKITWRG